MYNRAQALVAAIGLVATGCGAARAQRSTSSVPAAHNAAHQTRDRPIPLKPRPGAGLAYSTASNRAVQPQPTAGGCHPIGSGLYSRPDPSCTPGALNPSVTQQTIHRTMCLDGWTDTVRPPENVTEPEKAASMAAYGDKGSMDGYEYDHFVPLELGGATNDPRNLWPEPGASPNPKDAVEDELNKEVCDGRLTLGQAQREIVSNWTSLRARP